MITIPMRIANDSIVVPMSVSSSEQNVSMGVEGGIVHSSDYNRLSNRPKIEGVLLEGDKTFEELNLQSLTNQELEAMLVL